MALMAIHEENQYLRYLFLDFGDWAAAPKYEDRQSEAKLGITLM